MAVTRPRVFSLNHIHADLIRSNTDKLQTSKDATCKWLTFAFECPILTGIPKGTPWFILKGNIYNGVCVCGIPLKMNHGL